QARLAAFQQAFQQLGWSDGRNVRIDIRRPGGNVTGFMAFEWNLSGKWLELLKEVAPGVKRAAVLRDAANPSGIAQFSAIQIVAPSLAVEVSAVNVRDAE